MFSHGKFGPYFLRQDKRNFQTEDGRDHLPFRSFEGAATDAHASHQAKIPSTRPGPAIVAAPGVPYIVPYVGAVRWATCFVLVLFCFVLFASPLTSRKRMTELRRLNVLFPAPFIWNANKRKKCDG